MSPIPIDDLLIIRNATQAKLRKRKFKNYCKAEKVHEQKFRRFLMQYGFTWSKLPTSMDDKRIRLPGVISKTDKPIENIDSETMETLLVREYNKARENETDTLGIVKEMGKFWANRQKIQPIVENVKIETTKDEKQIDIFRSIIHSPRAPHGKSLSP